MNMSLSPMSDPRQTIASFVADVQMRLHILMEQQNVSRSELAERAHMSKSRISHIFGQHANITLDTLARLFHALGQEVTVTCPFLERVLSGATAPSMERAVDREEVDCVDSIRQTDSKDSNEDDELAFLQQASSKDLEHSQNTMILRWFRAQAIEDAGPTLSEDSVGVIVSEEDPCLEMAA